MCLDDSMRLEKMRHIDSSMQIRRYATILAATREKKAKGEKTDAMDYTEYVLPFSTVGKCLNKVVRLIRIGSRFD